MIQVRAPDLVSKRTRTSAIVMVQSCINTSLFEFSYVCPEPVLANLANVRFVASNGAQKAVVIFPHRVVLCARTVRVVAEERSRERLRP